MAWPARTDTDLDGGIAVGLMAAHLRMDAVFDVVSVSNQIARCLLLPLLPRRLHERNLAPVYAQSCGWSSWVAEIGGFRSPVEQDRHDTRREPAPSLAPMVDRIPFNFRVEPVGEPSKISARAIRKSARSHYLAAI